MKSPRLYRAREIRYWDADKRMADGTWIPARPLSYRGLLLRVRLKLAWAVFTGKYDALNWEQ